MVRGQWTMVNAGWQSADGCMVPMLLCFEGDANPHGLARVGDALSDRTVLDDFDNKQKDLKACCNLL